MSKNEPVASNTIQQERPLDASGKQGDQKKVLSKPSTQEVDRFLLDKLYPEAHNAFKPTAALSPTSNEVLVALDTNVLLLPYLMDKGDLSDLAKIYSSISEASRLFLPKRVAREFIKLRDRKLADMVQAIDDRISKINGWDARISSPLLEDFANKGALTTAKEAFDKATKDYIRHLSGFSKGMKAWRGNDPVTKLYANLFRDEHAIEPAESNEEIIQVLEYGMRNKVPPGYKDGGKDDDGIGDVVIWLSLLNLGKTKQKDLIFVTGEEKGDWFVRSGKNPLYPRPELVDAYRCASGGRSLRLSSLHDLLKEMSAPEALVTEVKLTEASANSAIQTASSKGIDVSSRHTSVSAGRRSFDYSTQDGLLRIEDDGNAFDLAFSKADNASIHIYKRGNTRRIARVKNVHIAPTSINAFDTSSTHYTIQSAEGFLVENDTGAVLAAHLVNIKDDTRGDDRDEVEFTYTINETGARVILPE